MQNGSKSRKAEKHYLIGLIDNTNIRIVKKIKKMNKFCKKWIISLGF